MSEVDLDAVVRAVPLLPVAALLFDGRQITVANDPAVDLLHAPLDVLRDPAKVGVAPATPTVSAATEAITTVAAATNAARGWRRGEIVREGISVPFGRRRPVRLLPKAGPTAAGWG